MICEKRGAGGIKNVSYGKNSGVPGDKVQLIRAKRLAHNCFSLPDNNEIIFHEKNT